MSPTSIAAIQSTGIPDMMESAFWPRWADRHISNGKRGTLQARSILVVEDEFLIAAELEQALRGEGADVVIRGTFDAASRFAASDCLVDSAVLDVKLGLHLVFPIADALAKRGVRIVFLTGYHRGIIPTRFAGAHCFHKPAPIQHLVVALTAN